MPRATSLNSESETERAPSKKQKKREESPAHDPMDEDGVEDEDEEEYEIEKILDSSETIFKDVRFVRRLWLRESDLNFPQREKAYLVKWKGYGESENSWVRESDAPYVSLALVWFGTHSLDPYRHADELISKYLDEKRAREKAAAAKKVAAKPRKSTEPTKQDHRKRGRISTKSKPDSEEDELEESPVRPTAKKQKKEKAHASNRKKVEPTPEEDVGMGEFTSMDKYMHLDSWDSLIDKIDTIERDEDSLFIYGTLWDLRWALKLPRANVALL